GKGFVPAGGLAVGNAIVTRAGPPLVVKSIEWQRSADGFPVYNFEVEGDHTYFVGRRDGGMWVHNGSCDPPTWRGGLKSAMGEAPFDGAQAHHGLVWRYRDWFAERGLNVNDSQHGWWVGDSHQSWSYGYGKEWTEFIAQNPDASKEAVLDFL